MAKIHEPDAYTHIFDNRNAIDEYFKLKHRLALTDKERFNLYCINPNTTIDISFKDITGRDNRELNTC